MPGKQSQPLQKFEGGDEAQATAMGSFAFQIDPFLSRDGLYSLGRRVLPSCFAILRSFLYPFREITGLFWPGITPTLQHGITIPLSQT